MDAGHLAGRSQLGYLLGMLLVGGGVSLGVEAAAWAGVALAAVAFAANLLAKARHYASLDISATGKTRVVATWGFLAATTVALLAVGVSTQFGHGYGRFFWPLVLLAVVLVVLHRVFRGMHVPEERRGE